MFEVLEFSWEELVKAMKHKAQDLDEIIAAHDKYLKYHICVLDSFCSAI